MSKVFAICTCSVQGGFKVWRRSVVAAVLVALKPRGGAYPPCSSTPATHLTLKPMGADTRAAKNRSLWGCVKTKNSTFPARVSVLIKYRNWYILRIRFGKNRRLWRCVKTKNSTFPVRVSHFTHFALKIKPK